MIQWTYIPEHAPQFGGLWESTVKSIKTHLRKILGEAKLTFEEYCTVLSQVETCLNSRPLVPLDSDEDSIEALTPGNFLVGCPLEVLLDPPTTFKSKSPRHCWNLRQTLMHHFWKCWSTDYFASLFVSSPNGTYTSSQNLSWRFGLAEWRLDDSYKVAYWSRHLRQGWCGSSCIHQDCDWDIQETSSQSCFITIWLILPKPLLHCTLSLICYDWNLHYVLLLL